jgi:restriction endonuclease S subunit
MRKNWTETTLQEVAEVIMGQSPEGNSYNQSGVGLPFMQGSAEFGEHYPSPEKWCSNPKKIAEPGDLLLSVRAPVGDTNFANQRIAIGRGLSVIRANSNSVTQFIRFVIQLNVAEMISSSGSGMFASITGQNLKKFKVLLPPLPDQKRIVDLISSVDSYIEALQQQLESAKKSRNALLHALLTAGGDDWVETTLGELCADGFFSDGDWVESKDQDPEGEYRLLQLADIGDGVFLNKSDRWMNQEQFMRLGCTKLEINDILIARMPDPIGRACLFPQGLPVCATVVDVAIVRTGNETLQKFLVLLINSSDFRTEAFSLLTGTTRQRISRGNLAKITFAIPPADKQVEIVSMISLFDGEIAQSARVIEEARQLRSGLLSDLLSGEHEIPASYDKVIGAA